MCARSSLCLHSVEEELRGRRTGGKPQQCDGVSECQGENGLGRGNKINEPSLPLSLRLTPLSAVILYLPIFSSLSLQLSSFNPFISLSVPLCLVVIEISSSVFKSRSLPLTFHYLARQDYGAAYPSISIP